MIAQSPVHAFDEDAPLAANVEGVVPAMAAAPNVATSENIGSALRVTKGDVT